jgi:hypothetical protein
LFSFDVRCLIIEQVKIKAMLYIELYSRATPLMIVHDNHAILSFFV